MSWRDTKKVIHFDLDGTLIDSVPDLALAINQMLYHFFKEETQESRIRAWVGNGASKLVERALIFHFKREISQDEKIFKEALSYFLEAYSKLLPFHTRCYAEVEETLQILQERGYRLTIITNKPYAFVSPLLEGLKIDGYFEAILGGDSLKRKKPDPLPLLSMSKDLGVEIASCVMVGDSKNDILSANRAGMDSIGVTYGYNYDESIACYSPTYTIEHFSQLLHYFPKQG